MYIVFVDQFVVHVRRPGIVALQNAKSLKYLGIKKGDVLGDVSNLCVKHTMCYILIYLKGEGDAYCNFTVTEDGKCNHRLKCSLITFVQ